MNTRGINHATPHTSIQVAFHRNALVADLEHLARNYERLAHVIQGVRSKRDADAMYVRAYSLTDAWTLDFGGLWSIHPPRSTPLPAPSKNPYQARRRGDAAPHPPGRAHGAGPGVAGGAHLALRPGGLFGLRGFPPHLLLPRRGPLQGLPGARLPWYERLDQATQAKRHVRTNNDRILAYVHTNKQTNKQATPACSTTAASWATSCGRCSRWPCWAPLSSAPFWKRR